MKIKVKDLEPNPFRKMESYPIDRAKVEALKTSISEKSFWDNILVRPHNGKYQIAYGHHRWVALQELAIKEIDIAVRDLEDDLMLKIMAEENLDWSVSPAITTQTVLVAKEFLDNELAKYEDWNHADKNIRVLFASNSQFQQNKKQSVGRDTILRFLGGNWKGWMIQEALKILYDKALNQEAIRTIPTMRQAEEFRKAVGDYKTPKKTQKKLAEKIVKEGIGRRDIPALLAKHSHIKSAKISNHIQKLVEDIDNHSRTLYNKIMRLRNEMKQLDIKQLRGIKVWLAKSALKRLFRELERLKKGVENENSR